MLTRRTPLARKTIRRGRPKRAYCTIRGCKRRPYIGGEWCISHAKSLADRLFSVYIKHRDEFCQRCGSTQNLDCSHHITRGRLATRYDPQNAVAHCRACHLLFTHTPALHTEWIVRRLGQYQWELLLDRAYGPRDENGVRHQPDANRPDYASVISLYRGFFEDAA